MHSDEELASSASWSWHHDTRWGHQFLYPEGWYRFVLTDGLEGVLYAPSADDWSTSFSVEVRELGTTVGPEDLDDLQEAFHEGLQSLPNCDVAWVIRWQVEPPIALEAKYTFRDGEVTRQRRSRLVYAGTRQFHVVVQGATPEEFRRWRPLLYAMLSSFAAAEEVPAPTDERADTGGATEAGT